MVDAKTSLFTIDELKAVTGAVVKSGDPRGKAFFSVAIDSRVSNEQGLFVCLKGERADGHDFIPQAAGQGASVILAASGSWAGRKESLAGLTETKDLLVLEVPDPLKGMQQLAKAHLDRFPEAVRIGVTGSNGKTTTKEILGSIFSCAGETYVNEGNFNSDIGLPLIAFKVGPHHKYVILEMGMNYKGEIDLLADIVRPHAGLITNIGRAHIGPMGSVEAIAEEKKKIFKYFDGPQKGFVYENEKFFPFLKDKVRGEILSYGFQGTRGFEGYRMLGLDGSVIYWEGLSIQFPLYGFHNLLNAIGALTLASRMGLGRQQIKEGLEKVKPLFGRSEIIKGAETIIQDCYNANPDSVAESLESFRLLPWQGRKIVVLGSMYELGEESRKAHRGIGKLAASIEPDLLFFFGEEMEEAYRAALKQNCGAELFRTSDFDVLAEKMKAVKQAGDLILLKGSRGIRLERLVEVLRKKAA